MTIRFLGMALLLAASTPLSAQTPGLTIKAGETWTFALYRGQPVRARKVSPSTKPSPGQVVVTVRSLMGTSLSIASNNPQPFTYKAELVGADKPVAVRSCTLPANGRLSFEHWPEKAEAVRLSNFKIAPKAGACP
jgi:hypothetical protein